MNRLSKILMIAVLGFISLEPVLGQKISSPAGGQFQGIDCQLDWTLGESAIQTYYNGPYILTQGFHQPMLLITKLPDGLSDAGINVYPNPTSDKFIISFREAPDAKTTARIYDLTGRLVYSEELHSTESVISVATLPAAVYSLNITIGNKKDHQFKIIKTLK